MTLTMVEGNFHMQLNHAVPQKFVVEHWNIYMIVKWETNCDHNCHGVTTSHKI